MVRNVEKRGSVGEFVCGRRVFTEVRRKVDLLARLDSIRRLHQRYGVYECESICLSIPPRCAPTSIPRSDEKKMAEVKSEGWARGH